MRCVRSVLQVKTGRIKVRGFRFHPEYAVLDRHTLGHVLFLMLADIIGGKPVRVQIPDHTSSLSLQTREEWTESVDAFCAKIKKAGYEPVICANTAAFNMLLNMDELEKYHKWLVDYGDYLYFPYEFDYWQYSIKGTVAGIEGDVPLDIYVTVEEEKTPSH